MFWKQKIKQSNFYFMQLMKKTTPSGKKTARKLDEFVIFLIFHANWNIWKTHRSKSRFSQEPNELEIKSGVFIKQKSEQSNFIQLMKKTIPSGQKTPRKLDEFVIFFFIFQLGCDPVEFKYCLHEKIQKISQTRLSSEAFFCLKESFFSLIV